MGLAIYDALPVLFFGITVILLGKALGSWLFLVGAVMCFWAGAAKVAWKIIVVKKRKNIWWMFMQMRIFMPIGFVLMIVGAILWRGKGNAGEVWEFAVTFPVALFFIIGIAGLILMGVAAAVLDSADAKSNWIEQTINTIAQLSLLIGMMFIAMSVGYYKADDQAKAALISDETVTVEVLEDEVIFSPAKIETKTGLIFYPGGKVEFTAYAPLMKEIAANGISVYLVKMPLNFAFLGSGKADDEMKSHPDIENWYLAGHSLGGAFASIHAAKHPEDVEGVILMGAYATKPLSKLKVMTIYGSDDGVMNREKYEQLKGNLPADYKEVVIRDGNHAMFGSYGRQTGDGMGKITPEEQWKITADAVIQLSR